MRFKLFSFTVLLAILCFNGVFVSQDAESKPEKEMPVFCKEFIGQVTFVQGRIMQLAEAVPQDKYTWRPAEGVRSISEVYRHVSFANYAFIKFAGHEPPVEISMEKRDSLSTGG